MAEALSLKGQIKRWGITCMRTMGWLFQGARSVSGTCAVEVVKTPGAHAFMGYYDVDLMRNRKLYFHRVAKAEGRSVNPKLATIVCHDLDTGGQNDICTTRALNWQIGARAQLIGPDCMILNDVDASGQLRAKEVNLTSGAETWLAFPVWYVGPESGLAVSVDFEELARQRPGYGYPGKIAADAANALVVFVRDTGQVRLRFTRDAVVDALEMPRAGYLNHVIATASEQRFLTTLNITTGGIRAVHPVIIEAATGTLRSFDAGPTFSHPKFIDETRLLYFDGAAFCIYDLSNDRKQVLYTSRKDGHPTQISPNAILSDTYPNRFSDMEVYLYDGAHRTLARVSNPPWYTGDLRCDLHPRYVDGTVLFDLPTVSGRMIGLLDLVSHDRP